MSRDDQAAMLAFYNHKAKKANKPKGKGKKRRKTGPHKGR